MKKIPAHIHEALISKLPLRMPIATGLIASALAMSALTSTGETEGNKTSPATGPLTILEANPRYFTDGSGKAIYLTGSHVWNNLSDIGNEDPPPAFDFDAFLDFQEEHGHNFIRLWRWESCQWDLKSATTWTDLTGTHTIAPHPWARTGPGKASDGKPKFDLKSFDPSYFERLRTRVEAAGRRGIYVSVMLFEGWELQHVKSGWRSHPFQKDNNINGIAGDANGDGSGIETHSLVIPSVVRLQEAYVRKVIETVGGLDNVLFEITNETGTYSTKWQYHLIRFIKTCEKARPKQHPVGMTFQYSDNKNQRGTNKILFDSPADWISPNAEAPGGHDYRSNPPVANGRKVIISDTDHLWGIGGDPVWAWKSFLRGHNPIFMDPYDRRVLGKGSPKQWEPTRRAMGQTRRVAGQLDLARMTPRPELASTKYCLADPGARYLVYQPDGGPFTIDLRGARGGVTVKWIDPPTGKSTPADRAPGGRIHRFTPPTEGPVVVLLEAVPTP